MSKLINGSFRLVEILMCAALAVMVIMVFGNVVLRYAFNSGITVSEELSRWLFVWLTFLGAIVGLREHTHLGTDILVSRLGRLGKRLCLGVSQALMLAVTLVFVKGSWAQLQINLHVEAPVTGASMAWVYAAGLLFSVVASLLLIGQLSRTLSGRLSEADLVMVQESEDRPHPPAKDTKP